MYFYRLGGKTLQGVAGRPTQTPLGNFAFNRHCLPATPQGGNTREFAGRVSRVWSVSSDRLCISNGFRKSSPPQNRRLNISISHSK